MALVLTAIVVLVVSVGCEGDDFSIEAWPFPVGSESQALFDAGLVGVWQSVPTGDEAASELIIKSTDARAYEIMMREGDDDAAVEMTGFVVDVGGVRVLNARFVKVPGVQVSGYELFRYELEFPDGLVVSRLEDDVLNERGMGSADELFRYLQVNAHDSTLYGKSTQYRRVALWGAQPNNRLQATVGVLGGGGPARWAFAHRA